MKISQILLVDDNPDFLALSREFLETHDDIRVVGMATSAQEALSLVESCVPTLLITDLVMPEISGLDLAQEVKMRWPGLLVIVMTMMDTPRHRQAAQSSGADAFVAKSSMDTDLLPIIRQLQNVML